MQSDDNFNTENNILQKCVKNNLLIEKDAHSIVTDKFYIKGYGAIYDIKDSQNDVIHSNAFSHLPDEMIVAHTEYGYPPNRLPMFFEHREIIGRWTEAVNTSKGLYLKGFIQRGIKNTDHIINMVQKGIFTGLSIAFTLSKSEIATECETGFKLRHILKGNPIECSIVPLGAQYKAQIEAVEE
jgi:HK97 family phage prohead protease